MDFIDPEKRRAHKIRLLIGYALITLAIIMTTLVLLYEAYGYGIGKNGQIIQNGLVFVNSNPNPASIYLNGVLNTASTNVRLELPAGEYTIKLARSGYRPWQRAVGVEGGSVERFDYPFLFPQNLVTTDVQGYAVQPSLVLQSPNRQWLLVQQQTNDTTFTEYDLTNPKQLTPASVTIPSSVVAANTAATWQVIGWSTDNIHVLLDRTLNGQNDYIVLNRQTPDQSVDVTRALTLSNTTAPQFNNNHFDQYYLFDSEAQTLSTAALTAPAPVTLSSHVLTYKAYGNNVILYATTEGAADGTVAIKLLQGSTTYTLRPLQAGAGAYLLNLAQYNGNWFIVEGDSSENKVYIYENPQAIAGSSPLQPLVPEAILKVNQPNFVAFSANTQFVMAENATSFAVYDAQNNKLYAYQTAPALPNGAHANWMDGDRIIYTAANGAVTVFDYDDANQQTLQSAVAGTQIYFDQAYKTSYTISPTIGATATTTPFSLAQTSMLIPSDQ